jgi:phosphatidylinositol glycan class Z
MTAITVDTMFYNDRDDFGLFDIVRHPVIAPLKSLLYNTQSANLALHGTHPHWQHFLVNLPQFLGPATILLFTNPIPSTTLFAALAGTAILSVFPHQEARFLLPAVPLMFSSLQLPQRGRRPWIAIWIMFNCLMGILMGVYHQGGIVEAQAYIRSQSDIGQAFWWKTYSPPTWILGDRNDNLATVDLMGLGKQDLKDQICTAAGQKTSAVLVAPRSAVFLDQFAVPEGPTANGLQLTERWSVRNHLNLDDMDFGDDGVVQTLSRVVGRRGLVVFDVRCSSA